MNTNTIKAALHIQIDAINDDKILVAVYTLLGNVRSDAKDYALNDDEMNMLLERDRKYQSGEMKTSTLDEFKAEMKNKFGYGA